MFLAMLSSGVTEPANQVNVFSKSVKEEKMKQVSCRPTLEQPKQPTCNKMTTVKQNRLVSVQLSGPFEEIYKEMETFAKPYISLLKLRRDLPRSFELKTTTSDSTRFLLKQKEKQLLDTSSEKDESYKALLVVHCIKIASDNVLHACLESAISHLSFIQDKNNIILGSCLNDLRQRLFHQQYRFQNNNTVHPKILAVCREANGIIQTKTDDKVLLVIVKRPVLSLMTLLKDNLAANGTIRPYIVTDNDDWTCLRNSTNNCLITSQKKLQDIDLSDVECLFEYESSNESILKAICENQETNFIGFTIQNFHNIPPINDMTKTKQDPDNIRDVYKHFQPITVIGSTSLTQHEDILHILESKYNISVIERDYSVIQELKSTSFADIVLDQNQAILLKDLLHLTEESNIELVTRQLASFALKYKKCWIILFMFDNTKGYPLSSQVLSNLFKLEAALANMSRKGQQDVAFKVKQIKKTHKS
ncbi:protein shortage in chiasmata 1 ortholog isoform X5 [Patella vulgata]|uniref:protein shortage in chiasmata 1 ortholog isoform X5 n=1 Tax=Patella vulgata TaxID=6465 RepID=UPI0024A7B999|nr:protein shortage in chiasmata 1 ortholog isoform X5 [Patella vulgata]